MNRFIERNPLLVRLGAVVIALLVWWAAALMLHQSLLLPSPWEVLLRFGSIWREKGFFARILFSLLRIVGGFLLAFVLGTLLAALAGRFRLAEVLLRPFMVTVKTVPVASFIILALIWLSSKQLSTFISFLMVLPVIYTNLLGGIHGSDPKLKEMADLYGLHGLKRLNGLWLPQLKESLKSALKLSLGLAWKAGIAAEVIGLPQGSIGDALYQAKAYLTTVDLMVWTVIIVIISVGFEKLVLKAVDLFYRRLEAK